MRTITYGYEQIAEYYRELIQMGTLRPGARLPTAREVAAAWSVSPSTVVKAWQRLKDDGLIRIQPGRGGGTFAAAPETQQPRE
jgi:DNA-binding GntR family transcriptional regulator